MVIVSRAPPTQHPLTAMHSDIVLASSEDDSRVFSSSSNSSSIFFRLVTRRFLRFFAAVSASAFRTFSRISEVVSMNWPWIAFRLPPRHFLAFRIASCALLVVLRIETCAARCSVAPARFIAYCHVGELSRQSEILRLNLILCCRKAWLSGGELPAGRGSADGGGVDDPEQ